MKTYQPNNGPIKFVVVNTEYNDDHTYNKTIIDVIYTTKKDMLVYQHSTVGRKQPQSIDVPTKMNQDVDVRIGFLGIEGDTPRNIDTSNITWRLSIDKTPYDTFLRSPYYVTNHTTINNTDYDFNKLLEDIAERIVQYYKNTKMEQPEKGIAAMKENECNQEDVTKLPDALRKRIKINNIIYNLSGVPNQSPTPIYEIEVDLTGIGVYPHIKSVLLNVYVCYDGTSQKFHTKVETVRINGVSITDFQLDDVGFMELTAIYMHDALKRIDFTSAIENHLRMLNSRLDLCHKILNSNLES
jgi:hypothetical protein